MQQGDKAAFRKLYDMYAINICGAINLIVSDTNKSEEICQDVFLTVWQKSAQYNPSKGRFFTWLLNIARNRAIDHVRSSTFKQEKQNLSADLLVGIAEDGAFEDEVVHPQEHNLKQLIEGLTQKCREIIAYLYFRGYTQKAVAEELKIPLGTVKTRNRDCIGRLRKNLNERDGRQ